MKDLDGGGGGGRRRRRGWHHVIRWKYRYQFLFFLPPTRQPLPPSGQLSFSGMMLYSSISICFVLDFFFFLSSLSLSELCIMDVLGREGVCFCPFSSRVVACHSSLVVVVVVCLLLLLLLLLLLQQLLLLLLRLLL